MASSLGRNGKFLSIALLLNVVIIFMLLAKIPTTNPLAGGFQEYLGTKRDTLFSDKQTERQQRVGVFLPLVGLGQAHKHDIRSQTERLIIERWMAIAIKLYASEEGRAGRIILSIYGMVEHQTRCDPYLEKQQGTSRRPFYRCLVLPPECLKIEYGNLPTMDCIFDTIQKTVLDINDLVVFANSDILFSTQETTAVIADVFDNDDHRTNDSDERKGGETRGGSKKKSKLEEDFVMVGQRIDVPIADVSTIAVDKGGYEFWKLMFEKSEEKQKHLSGILHSDVGIDYFILPARLLPRNFPPFLVGRFRWDNALLASFILPMGSQARRQKAQTIDVTPSLKVSHLGRHANDRAYFMAQAGSQYNDELANIHYGNAYMLGRSHNTDFLLCPPIPSAPPAPTTQTTTTAGGTVQRVISERHTLEHRPIRTDEHLLQVIERAHGWRANKEELPHDGRPFSLLISVMPNQVQYMKQLWGSVNASIVTGSLRQHSILLTWTEDSYQELAACFPQALVILGEAEVWPVPMSASLSLPKKWGAFETLMQVGITVGIIDAKFLPVLSAPACVDMMDALLSGRCDIILGNPATDSKHDYQFVVISPSEVGKGFWEEINQIVSESEEKSFWTKWKSHGMRCISRLR